jgi:hypothetical protein
MAIAAITAWLKDKVRHYETGALLYAEYGDSVLLKSFFAKGKSPYHIARLEAELEKLQSKVIIGLTLPSPKERVVAPAPAVPAPSRPERFSLSDKEWDAAPDYIKDLYAENNRLSSERQLNFHQARVAGSDEARLKLGLQILEASDKINQNWKEIKEFHATGKLKERLEKEQDRVVDDLTTQELMKEARNIPTYITKARKRLEQLPDGSKRNDVLARIQSYEVKLNAINKRLGNV